MTSQHFNRQSSYRRRLLPGLALWLALFLGIGLARPVLAATSTIADAASCQAFGGVVDFVSTYCDKDSVTIAPGDTLILQMGLISTDLTNNGTVTNGPGPSSLFTHNLTNNVGATIDNYRELRVQESGVNYGNINVFADDLVFSRPFTNASTGRITLHSGTALELGAELVNQGAILLDCGVQIRGKGAITGNPVQYLNDCIAPTANPSQTPAKNGAGWNNSDVTVNWNWTDNAGGKGIDPANCTNSSTSSGEGALTLTATCKDLAGNQGSATYTVKVDKIAPVISGSRTPATNAAGWNNSAVTASFTCADNTNGSGLATNTVAGATLSGEGANQTVTNTGACVDTADNAAAAVMVSGINIDLTKPTLSAAATSAANANGWYNSNVTVHFSCADNLAGVTNCPADQVLSSEGNAVASAPQIVTDKADNQSAASNVVTVQIDKTAPVVTVAGVSNGASYTLGSVPTVGCSTTDALSGVATQATRNVTGGNPAGTGSFTATCSGATDKAGNSAAPVSVTYTVAYKWMGFAGPVNNPPAGNTANAGQAISLKFSLGGNFGLNIFASGYPASQPVNCSTGGSTGPLTPITAPGNSGLQYDAKTQTYTYVWKTDKAWAGTCRQLIVKLMDGTQHTALFQFNGQASRTAVDGEVALTQQIFLPLVNR